MGSTAKSIFYAPLSDTTLLTRMTYAGVDEGGTGYDDILLGWGHAGDRFIYANALITIEISVTLPSGITLNTPIQKTYYQAYMSSVPVGQYRAALKEPFCMNSINIMKNN